MQITFICGQLLLVTILGLIALSQPFRAAAQSGGVQVVGNDDRFNSLGRFYALVIGNNKYKFLPTLDTPENDAQEVAKVLRNDYGFETTLLLNATRSDIINALLNYRQKLPENSHLLLYYAGHGQNDREANVAYWLPVDAERVNTANWISADDLTADLRAIRAAHILVVADSCFSGAMRGASSNVEINSNLNRQEILYYLLKVERITSRNLLASGGDEPVADGGPNGHSIFAAVFLQSLRDQRGPEFTGASLFESIVVRVAGRSRQTPRYSAIVNSGHDGGDFIFYRVPYPTLPMPCCSIEPGVPSRSGDSPGPIRTESVETQVRQVIEQYRQAYHDEDLDALRNLWPSMAPQKARNLQQFFRSASSVSLTYTMVSVSAVDKDTADLEFVEDLQFLANGRPNKVPGQKVKMKLRRIPDASGQTSWKIDSIE